MSLSKKKSDAEVINSTKDFKTKEINNTYFKDVDFPPNKKSLGYLPIKQIDTIRWKRPHELGSTNLVHDGISATDVCQGHLGNCWLISAIVCIAQYPSLIKRLFPGNVVNSSSAVQVRLFNTRLNKWTILNIDSSIPCKNTNGRFIPVFSRNPKSLVDRTRSFELWPLLLEKAFAKYVGNYGMLKGGYSSFAFTCMTGITDQRCFVLQTVSPEIWKRDRESDPRCSRPLWVIKKQQKPLSDFSVSPKSSLMFLQRDERGLLKKCTSRDVCSYMLGKRGFHEDLRNQSHSVPISSVSSNHVKGDPRLHGLSRRHAYSVLGTFRVHAYASRLCSSVFVRLRNPWGSKREWKGMFSDNWYGWDEMDPDISLSILESCGHIREPDGTFLMNWVDFVAAFTHIHTFEIGMDSIY